MTTHHDDARQLQLKMSQMRGRIAAESGKAADQARRALDWKHQVASHPLTSAAVAIALGYWMIPGGKNKSGIDSLNEMRTLLENQARPQSARSGIGKTLAWAAGSVLMRNLVSGAVSKAIASFAIRRDQSSSECQAPGVNPDLTPVDEGTSDDD